MPIVSRAERRMRAACTRELEVELAEAFAVAFHEDDGAALPF